MVGLYYKKNHISYVEKMHSSQCLEFMDALDENMMWFYQTLN